MMMEKTPNQHIIYDILLLKKRSALIGLGFGVSGVLMFALVFLIALLWSDTPLVGGPPISQTTYAKSNTAQLILITGICLLFLIRGSSWAGRRVAIRVLKGKDVFLAAFFYTYVVLWVFGFLVLLGFFLIAFDWESFEYQNLFWMVGLIGLSFLFAFFPTCVFGPLLGFTLQRLAESMGFEVKTSKSENASPTNPVNDSA